jgi:hypothetical protein
LETDAGETRVLLVVLQIAVVVVLVAHRCRASVDQVVIEREALPVRVGRVVHVVVVTSAARARIAIGVLRMARDNRHLSLIALVSEDSEAAGSVMLSATVAIAQVIPEATKIELLIEIRSISQQL